jgi:hypothetical protein
VSAADVTKATVPPVPGPTNNAKRERSDHPGRHLHPQSLQQGGLAWPLALSCQSRCLVSCLNLAGSEAEGAKPACAPETPVLPPTSSAHPFQVFLRRTEYSHSLHRTPTLPHPSPSLHRTPRAQGYSSERSNPCRTLPEETPRHPKGKLPTHRPVHLHFCSSLSSIGLVQLALENFYCLLLPRSLSDFHFSASSSSSQASLRYVHVAVRFNKAPSRPIFPNFQSTSFSVEVLLRDTYTQDFDIGADRNPPYSPSTLSGPSVLDLNLITLNSTY